ncbi:MAG: ribulose-phosphate 3-epimerase [Chloroflexi bacterium]|nr:ribulose-phosphate 3-epimerase [Chloroflexota bacterium]
MPNRPKIAPSILSADFTRLGAAVAEAERAGADWIHIDVMDGHFVPNLTMGPFIVEAIRRATTLPLDVHLMIEAPERLIPAFAKAGADHLTVHVEACPHLYRVIQQIRELGLKSGVALNPGTPAGAVSEVLDKVDVVLAMTVNPGFSGQKFIESVLPKVQQLREMLDWRNSLAEIEVDGGIDAKTAPLAAKAGATAFVAATAVFQAGMTVDEAMAKLRKSLA